MHSVINLRQREACSPDPGAATQRLQMIVGLARAVAQTRTDPAAIAEVTAGALIRGYADGCWIQLVSTFGVAAFAHRDLDAEEFLREVIAPLPTATLPFNAVLADGKPVFVTHAGPELLDSWPPEVRVYTRRFPIRGVIMVPIRTRDAIVGVLAVWRDYDDSSFQDDDLNTAHVCAEHVALALEHAAVFQQLRDREARFELAARATQDAMWDWHLGTSHVDWNEALNTTFGWPKDQVIPTSEWWLEQVHPDDRERVGAGIQRALRDNPTGLRWQEEYRFLRGDGGYARVVDRGYVLRDSAGRPLRAVGSMQDVSDHYPADPGACERAELFTRVFTDNPSAMTVNALPAGEHLEVNAAALRMSGFTREELLGRTPQELGVFERPEDSRRYERLLAAGGAAHNVELNVRSRHGPRRTVLLSTARIERRGRPCTLQVVADITARKRAERVLLESEERFRQIAATIHEAFWLMEFEPDGHYVYVSPGWQRAWGRRPDELYADPTLWTRLVHPDDRAAVERSQRELATGAIDSFDLEYRLCSGDGATSWIRDRGTLIRDAAGRPWRAAGLAVDITERELAARERERLVADLQVAIAVRDDFLSIASHELRTPLTALGFHLEHLVRLVERGERDPRVLARKVNGAARQSDRVLALVDSLISVSRMSLGQLTLEPTEFDLVELLRELLARLGADAQRARCELRLDAPAAVLGAWDRRQIVQVFHNILANALKYGAGRPVEVRVRAADHGVTLEVKDHGIGIAEADMPRIFDRFERAVSSLHYGGFGLGLYTARRMVEAHGGSLNVVSVPGCGSTFRVRLPRVAVQP